MFAFVLWDERRQELFCARDPFGIKPFYYYINGSTFYFSSEAKALFPFVDEICTDQEAFSDYLVFQFCLDDKTLFRDIFELKPAHYTVISGKGMTEKRYWQVYYEPDFYHTEKYFFEEMERLFI